jgi:hypothetical protein
LSINAEDIELFLKQILCFSKKKEYFRLVQKIMNEELVTVIVETDDIQMNRLEEKIVINPAVRMIKRQKKNRDKNRDRNIDKNSIKKNLYCIYCIVMLNFILPRTNVGIKIVSEREQRRLAMKRKMTAAIRLVEADRKVLKNVR